MIFKLGILLVYKIRKGTGLFEKIGQTFTKMVGLFCKLAGKLRADLATMSAASVTKVCKICLFIKEHFRFFGGFCKALRLPTGC